MAALNTAFVRKTLATLRQASIERIRFFKERFAQKNIAPYMSAELEFVGLNKNGVPAENLIHERKLTEALRETVPSFERVARENAAQYEFVAGKNPNMPGIGISDMSPEKIAETVTAFQEGLKANAARWGIGGASYDARVKFNGIPLYNPTHINSGAHFNISLWDKAGTNNLFYKPGQVLISNEPTTELQRHVIDSLIKTHAEGGLLYAPHPASYSRLQSTQKSPYNPLAWWDILTGVPNTAGYIPNKSLTMEFIGESVLRGVLTGHIPIGSVTSRYRSAESAALGIAEKIGYGGSRTSGIGMDKWYQHRLESRLAGADADIYVAATAESASLHEAVQKHVHIYNPKQKLNDLTDRLIRAGERPLVVDAHYKPFDAIPLAMNHAEAGARFAQSERLRRLLGEDVYLSAVAHARPAEGPHVAKLSAERHATLTELQREADAHVEKIGVEQYETTDITRKIRETMDKMEPPTPGPDWKERVKNDLKGRLGIH